MLIPALAADSTVVVGVVLGLRHGLDPDHIAVIDNLTFRLAAQRSRMAPWVGALFALGHSLSVAAVAVGVSLAAVHIPLPAWLSEVVSWGVIGLLILVGFLNLKALRGAPVYAPVGFRQGLAPKALLASSHPLAIIAIGVIFGLVFDTATQAAAWGLAAASQQGFTGVVMVSAAFAAGMILTDTLDSQIVARLLRSDGDPTRVRLYRRGVGWLIVCLSFGMAGYALAVKIVGLEDMPDALMSAVGLAMAFSVTAMLIIGRPRPLQTAKALD